MHAQAVVYALALIGAVAAPLLFFGLWLFRREMRRPLLAWAAVLALPYFLCVWTFILEPKTFSVRHVTIESARWAGPPLKIGVISDIHIAGVHVPAKRVAEIVARMNEQTPDVVVLLGDYVDHHRPAARRSAAERAEINKGISNFSALKAPKGVFAVLGNHDVWYDEGELVADLRGAGAAVLEDQVAPLAGTSAWIVGLNEYSMVRTNYARTADQAPAGAPLIVLSHYPDAMRRVDNRAALTLAGHTHCGQLGVPVINRLVVASRGSRRWLFGYYEGAGKPLFVTGGIGTSILPIRFLRPPEIVVLTLKAKP